jgi:3-phosphoshikimate 1-carboxyvinyltransferase
MSDMTDERIAMPQGMATPLLAGQPAMDTVHAPFTLIVAALAAGSSRLTGLGRSVEVEAAASAMRAMGARVEWQGDDGLVEGTGNGCLLQSEAPLDLGGAVDVARLVAGLVATYDMETVVAGVDASGQGASMAKLLAPLRAMGVQVLETAPGERLPVRLAGPRMAAPILWRVPADAPWVRPTLLLAALNTPGITSIVTTSSDEDGVEAMLRRFGAKIDVKEGATGGERTVSIEGRGRLMGCTVEL